MDSNNSIEWMTPTPNNFYELIAKHQQEIVDACGQTRVLSGYKFPYLQAPKITDPGWMPVMVDVSKMVLDPDKDRLIDALLNCLKKQNGETN